MSIENDTHLFEYRFPLFSRWFFYFIRTRPRKSVVICKTFSKFAVSQGVMPSALHIDESVFAFILGKKSDNFNETRITTALISCIVMWLCTLCAYTPYYPSVGSCIVYSFQGFVRTSYQINGSQLHTFFIILTAHSGLVGKNFYHYEEISSIFYGFDSGIIGLSKD